MYVENLVEIRSPWIPHKHNFLANKKLTLRRFSNASCAVTCNVLEMAVVELHSHPVLVKYRASLCTKGTIFIIIVFILTVIPPLLIAYRSEGLMSFLSHFTTVEYYYLISLLKRNYTTLVGGCTNSNNIGVD